MAGSLGLLDSLLLILSLGMKQIDPEIEEEDRRNHNPDQQYDSSDERQPEYDPPQTKAEIRELRLKAAAVLIEVGEIWKHFLLSDKGARTQQFSQTPLPT